MAKFKVTFMPSTGKTPIEVEAADMSAVSDYTVQFYDVKGTTIRVVGGIAEVERVEQEGKPFEFAATDTEGKPVQVPHGTLDGWPCQAVSGECSPEATPPSPAAS